MSREKGRMEMSTRDATRVETLLKDLERDVERRERFLRFPFCQIFSNCLKYLICDLGRECGRMVGAFPELEEEVNQLFSY